MLKQRSPAHALNVKKIDAMLVSIEKLYKHGEKIGSASGGYAMLEARELKNLTTCLAASFLPNSNFNTAKITERIENEIDEAYDNMKYFRSYSKPILLFLTTLLMNLIGKKAPLVAAEGFFSKTERQIKLKEIQSTLDTDFLEEGCKASLI